MAHVAWYGVSNCGFIPGYNALDVSGDKGDAGAPRIPTRAIAEKITGPLEPNISTSDAVCYCHARLANRTTAVEWFE